MTFTDFAETMAARTQQFLGDAAQVAAETAPMVAEQVQGIAATLADDVAAAASISAQKVVDLSSRAATAAGDLIENTTPSNIVNAFKNLVDIYSGDVSTAANGTDTTDNQPQDASIYPISGSEVYVSGMGGESGGGGASGAWEEDEPGRYPHGVTYPRPPLPPLPPQSKKKRLPFTPPTQPQACVNKRVPILGQAFYWDIFTVSGGRRLVVRWWDNIRVTRQQNGGTFAPSNTEIFFQYHSQPFPASLQNVLTASNASPPSQWMLSTYRSGVSLPSHPDYYIDKKSCNWTNEFWKDDPNDTPDKGRFKYGEVHWESAAVWAECWPALYDYGNPGGSWAGNYGIKAAGNGRSECFTYAEASFVFVGEVDPTEIRPQEMYAATFAGLVGGLGMLEALRPAFSLLSLKGDL